MIDHPKKKRQDEATITKMFTGFMAVRTIRTHSHLHSLRFLNYFVFVWRSLNLSHNRLTDVSALAELQDLRVLNVSKNKISSVTGIVDLPSLEELWLRDNAIADIRNVQCLAALTSLRRLVFKPNPVCKLVRPQRYVFSNMLHESMHDCV